MLPVESTAKSKVTITPPFTIALTASLHALVLPPV